jgi:hypothetical protein
LAFRPSASGRVTSPSSPLKQTQLD